MILITGINGEIGSALAKQLFINGKNEIIGFDLNGPNQNLKKYIKKHYVGDIINQKSVKKVFQDNEITEIYHLAAILSSKGEEDPFLAHKVNVDGFLNVIQSINTSNIKFFFPSSIAVYRLNRNAKTISIIEDDFCNPNNIYGCNKLYCEKIGSYFEIFQNIDFRSLRFSGIISAYSLPQGGTSDYAPEMIHHAVQNKNYTCFVREDSCIPFMIMPDAVNAIINLMDAKKSKLNRNVYHIQAFSPTVKDIYEKIISHFPNFNLVYDVNAKRQKLIDGWPAQLNQKNAEEDWGWKPEFNFDNAFENYLIPKIKEFYKRR
tara:strand:- start:22088 stop:23041 length:954 start_codon:yes stop_codon:yes gene_type:complete